MRLISTAGLRRLERGIIAAWQTAGYRPRKISMLYVPVDDAGAYVLEPVA